MLMKKVGNWLSRFYTWREGNRFSIGVFGAIFDNEGRILLVRQKGREKFGLPGGGVSNKDINPLQNCSSEAGDSLFKLALFRELEEEIGIERGEMLKAELPRNFPSARLKDLCVLYMVKISDNVHIQPTSEIAQIRFISQDKFEAQVIPIVGLRMARMIEWAFNQAASD